MDIPLASPLDTHPDPLVAALTPPPSRCPPPWVAVREEGVVRDRLRELRSALRWWAQTFQQPPSEDALLGVVSACANGLETDTPTGDLPVAEAFERRRRLTGELLS